MQTLFIIGAFGFVIFGGWGGFFGAIVWTVIICAAIFIFSIYASSSSKTSKTKSESNNQGSNDDL